MHGPTAMTATVARPTPPRPSRDAADGARRELGEAVDGSNQRDRPTHVRLELRAPERLRTLERGRRARDDDRRAAAPMTTSLARPAGVLSLPLVEPPQSRRLEPTPKRAPALPVTWRVALHSCALASRGIRGRVGARTRLARGLTGRGRRGWGRRGLRTYRGASKSTTPLRMPQSCHARAFRSDESTTRGRAVRCLWRMERYRPWAWVRGARRRLAIMCPATTTWRWRRGGRRRTSSPRAATRAHDDWRRSWSPVVVSADRRARRRGRGVLGGARCRRRLSRARRRGRATSRRRACCRPPPPPPCAAGGSGRRRASVSRARP